MVDYVDVGAATVDKFKISSLNNPLTGMKTYMGKRMPKRTNAAIDKDQAEDVVITWG